MQKPKQLQKNLSQQAIDLINYYHTLKTSITNETALINLNKKKSLYDIDQPIVEEDIEESPIDLKRNCSRTEHIHINIYSNSYDLDEELQQDVKQLKQTLNQRISQLKSIINLSEMKKNTMNSNNKENYNYNQNTNKQQQKKQK